MLKAIGQMITMDKLLVAKTTVKNSTFPSMAGPNIIGEHHETGLVVGDNTVVFNFEIKEDTVIDWDGSDQFNPEVQPR